MALNKQAKILTPKQQELALSYLERTRYPKGLDAYKRQITDILQNIIDTEPVIQKIKSGQGLTGKQKQLNKIVYDVLNKAFAHKMKSFPSKFKKKLSGIFSDITPKQFFNLNYFDAHEHRCCLCGRLLDHDAKELPVAEIEHLFPQSKFPQLILCISNYIPCCSNCNKIKKSSFFSCKKEFIEDLQKLGKSFHHPLFFWKLFDANFDYNLPAVKKCDIVQYYKINERFNQIRHYMYSNLFNLVKYHNIETPEALESFLESCQNANMQEMVSDFSLNNHPKLWHDFIDYVLYDYNNLTALWEEIKEYNKLKYYC